MNQIVTLSQEYSVWVHIVGHRAETSHICIWPALSTYLRKRQTMWLCLVCNKEANRIGYLIFAQCKIHRRQVLLFLYVFIFMYIFFWQYSMNFNSVFFSEFYLCKIYIIFVLCLNTTNKKKKTTDDSKQHRNIVCFDFLKSIRCILKTQRKLKINTNIGKIIKLPVTKCSSWKQIASGSSPLCIADCCLAAHNNCVKRNDRPCE